MRLALVCFYCLCVFVYVLYFIATMSFAGYLLSVLLCLLSMLISDSRFDLVWFRLSCDHGWIRSGSVNVRKQQQQGANADREILVFPIQLTTSRIGNLTRLIHTLAICATIQFIHKRKVTQDFSPPSFCGVCLNFSREKDSAVPFPRRP